MIRFNGSKQKRLKNKEKCETKIMGKRMRGEGM